MLWSQSIPDVPQFGAGPVDDGIPWLNVLAWVFAVIVPLVTSAVAGIFAWKAKAVELRSKNEVETQKLLSEQFTASQEQQRSFYETVLAEGNTLRTQNNELRSNMIKLRSELGDLSEKLEYYENNPAIHLSREIVKELMNRVMQREAWIHDVSHKRWYVNDAFAKTFSIERIGYWHPINLFARFPAEDVAEYINNDLDIIESGVEVTLEEQIRLRVMDPLCEQYTSVTVRKVPIEVAGSGLIFGEVLESLEDTQF